jgi:hypothetical protein
LNITGICNSSTTPLVNVTLNYNGSAQLNTSDVLNATPFYFNVTAPSDGYYYYNITCYSTNTVSSTSETRLLKIDSTPPNVLINQPTNSSSYNTLNPLTINVTASDAVIGLDKAVTNHSYWTGVYSPAGNYFNFTNTSALTLGTHCVNVTVNDSLNNYNYSYVCFTLTTDFAPYAVNILTPPNQTTATQQYLNITGICNSSTTPLINITLNYNAVSTVNSTTVTNGTPFYFNVSVASDGRYYYNVTCYSTNAMSNTSETRLLRVDTMPPSYGPDYDDAGGVTYDGAVINVYVYWTDAGAGLDAALFRTNQTGAWANVSTCAFAGTAAGWCNTTINTAGSATQTICWNQYANDTLAYLNATMPENTHCFYVSTNKPPQIALNQPANGTQYSDVVNADFNFTATDDQNTTFSCSIYLDAALNQTNASTANNTLTDFLINGITAGNHTWLVNCSDGELKNVSETRSFSVAGVVPSPTPGGGGGGPQCTDNSQCPVGQYCNGNVCVACSCGLDGVCHVCCPIIGQSDPDCATPSVSPSPTYIPTLTPTPTEMPTETPSATLIPTPFVTPSLAPSVAPTIKPSEKSDLEGLLREVEGLLGEAKALGLSTDVEQSEYDKARQQLAAGNFEPGWNYGTSAKQSLEPRILQARMTSWICVISLLIAIILFLLLLYLLWKRRLGLEWDHKLEQKMLRR